MVHSTCSQALQGTREQKLSEDLLTIIIIIITNNNGRRAAENRRRKEEGKIVEENEYSNYDKKYRRTKKEYIYPERAIKIQIDYKAQYSQQEKLKL